MKASLVCLSCALVPVSQVATALDQTPALYTQKILSVESANTIAWGTLNECRKRGYSVSVAVVDRGGNLQVLLRDRFAGPHTPETAIRKAWTANSFRQSTAELAAFLQAGHVPDQVQHNPGALLVGGGITVEAQGTTLGGVGVSGAPPGQSERDSIDAACARAGVQAIQDSLELAD